MKLRLVAVPLLVSTFAWADVRYRKNVVISGQGVEAMEVVNRLGSLTVHGWDRPEVRVTAIKQASNATLAERLRVLVSQSAPATLQVKTYVQIQARQRPKQLGALLHLMHRQQRVIDRLALGSVQSVDLRLEVQRQLARLKLELADLSRGPQESRVAPAKVSLPVSEGRLDLELWVPRSLKFRAQTFKHPIAVSGIQSGADLASEEGTVTVRQSGGHFVSRAQRGAQRLVDVNGSVTVEGGDAEVSLRQIRGPVRVLLLSGRIVASDLEASSVDLQSVLGDISVAGVLPKGAAIQLISRDGNLQIELPPQSSFNFSGQAPRWQVDLHRELLQRLRRQGDRLEGCLGDCQGRIKLTTAKGLIHLTAQQ